MMTYPVVVLDACAVIAYLNGESGGERLDSLLAEHSQFTMSAINALEVAYDAARVSPENDIALKVIHLIEQIPCRIEWTLSTEVFQSAAHLKAHNRISVADSIALAYAQSLGAPLASTDHHEFDPIEHKYSLQFFWLR